MRNDWFLWYLVGRRRGRREALEAMDRPRRGKLRALFLFVLCVLFLSAIVYAWAFISAALERTH